MPKRKAAAKRKQVAGARRQAGNVSSADKPALARPWTDEEMAAAKPLPMPTVDPAPEVPMPSVPHAGKGETKPAGRPEDDDEAAR